jgi:hypothetical protein
MGRALTRSDVIREPLEAGVKESAASENPEKYPSPETLAKLESTLNGEICDGPDDPTFVPV